MAGVRWLQGLALLLGACAAPPGDPGEDMDAGAMRVFESAGRSVRYVDTGEAGKPLVVFIHGTPGSWRNFERFLAEPRLKRQARLVAVDRPGFGASAEGGVLASISGQARALEPLLDLDPERRVILVAHSWGGPIAARLAIERPERIAGLVLVAAPLDPALEGDRWYRALGRQPWLAWLLPESLRRANRELLGIPGQLRALAPDWERLEAPVWVVQGGRDRLVEPGNAEFLRGRVAEERLRVRFHPDAGHLIPWAAPERVIEPVLEALDGV